MTELTMRLRQKLLVTPGKIARKLRDWSPDYDGDEKKERDEKKT
jgi:hypothetical protein